MPLLIDPETGARVRATGKGAEILREQGYTDAEPADAIGGPTGVPAAEQIIVDNLRARDWNAGTLARLRRFVASGDRRYAQAVLDYERGNQNRDSVVAMIEARLQELPETDDTEDGDEDGRPAKSASRADWDEYARSLGIDPEEHSSKEDLIAAVDEHESDQE